jgi:uncharacterized protein YuzE
MNRILNKIGEYNFDFKNDIFFFKVKDREYSHSIEMNNAVIDFDEEDFVVGLQIFNASEFFEIDKKLLNQIKKFKMQAKIENNIIKIKIEFSMNVRNKEINYTPIIFERIGEEIPNSEIICTV